MSNESTNNIQGATEARRLDITSSADHVDQHLQQIESHATGKPQRSLSPEEQLFTEEELARLINPNKLQSLMNSGDELVNYLMFEIDKFAD